MSPLAVRQGDHSDHGGTVTTGAARTRIAGAPAAREGDEHTCPIILPTPHGVTPIVTGSATVRIEGKPAARQGDLTACGAALIAGQGTVTIG